MAVIELEGVARRYAVGDGEVTALHDVDLDVGEGEFLVVLGPSGCGKTTLLKQIGALDTPSEGSVRVAGHVLDGASRKDLFRFRRETVSFVFQSFNLFPALTARENVQFAIDVARRHRPGPTAAEVLDQVGLGDRLDHFSHQLSGGEQQRVAIARGLVNRPPVILADEPTAPLDSERALAVMRILGEMARAYHTAIVVVTHDEKIIPTFRRLYHIRDGVTHEEAGLARPLA